jgi:hypothetical protein
MAAKNTKRHEKGLSFFRHPDCSNGKPSSQLANHRGLGILSFFVSFCAFSWPYPAAAAFSFDDIQYWVGAGANRAALVIDWSDTSAQPAALVWGFRWDGDVTGQQMLNAVVAADTRLFAKISDDSDSQATYALGYDANNNGQFGAHNSKPPLFQPVVFDSLGFSFEGPDDNAVVTEPGDYYAEGWFDSGFWHYGIASSNPYDGGAWTDISSGPSLRTLADGAWDSWTFSPLYNFSSYPENPLPAAPPTRAPGDFNGDGHVNDADYVAWRSEFGTTDASGYVVWRKAATDSEDSLSLLPPSVPEPSAAWLAVLSWWGFLSLKRKERI